MTCLGLAELLAPVTIDEFVSRHWEPRRFGHIAVPTPERLALAREVRDIDVLIGSVMRLEPSAIELVKSSHTYRQVVAPGKTRAAQLLDDGYTARINGAQKFLPALQLFAHELESSLGFPININVYVSPPSSEALPIHFDRHDVFVLQVAGSKRWRMYSSVEEDPLEYLAPMVFESRGLSRARLGARRKPDPSAVPELETVLEPGSVLYIPRGVAHAASACGEPSLHITIGVQVVTVLDILQVALAERARSHPELRASLPIGLGVSFRDRARTAADVLRCGGLVDEDVAAALSSWIESFVRAREWVAAPRWKTPGSVGALHWIRRRRGRVTGIFLHEDRAMLRAGSRGIEVPRGMRRDLEVLASGRWFRPVDLPSAAPLYAKRELVERALEIDLLETGDGETS